MIITTMLVILGLLYNIPKIALKDRFIFKTLCISLGMMLSLMMGSSTGIVAMNTSVHNYDIHILTPKIMKKSNDADHLRQGRYFRRQSYRKKDNTYDNRKRKRCKPSDCAGNISTNYIWYGILYFPDWNRNLQSYTRWHNFSISYNYDDKNIKVHKRAQYRNQIFEKKTFPLHIILHTSLMIGSMWLLISR